MAVLRSKIRPPALPPFAVLRPRLLEQILAPRWRAVLLQAPAGYGKSTLAVQAAAAAPRTTAWLHLDRDEAEPRRFCRYVTAAIGEVLPAIASTELEAMASAPGFDPERWAEDLLLFFEEVARTGCRLILDNAETIADAEGPLACVRRLIEPGSERLRLLMATRRAPVLPLQRLAAQGRALVLGAEALAFDLDEYGRAAGAHGWNAPAEEVEGAWERSGGWCVLLGLGAGSGEPAAAPGRGLAYLEEEVLGRLPAPLRGFLVRTSVLDVVTPEGLAALGIEAADLDRHAAMLTLHGVPHLPIGEGAGVRLHPLIRERFLAELRMNGADARQFAERAVRHCRDEGRYEAAVHLLADLALDEEALRLLHEDWNAIERLNLQPRVEDWLGRLGKGVAHHPQYVAVMARCLRFRGENRRLADLLEQSKAWIPADSPLAPQLWALETWAATSLAEGPGYAARASEWEALRGRAVAGDVALAEFSLANAAMYDLRLEAAMAHVEAGLAALPPDTTLPRASARNAAAVVLQELGRSHEALAVHDANIEACRRDDDVAYLTLNMVGRAYVLKELGRYAESLATIDACLEAARRAGGARLVLESHLTRTRGECWWQLGRRREGLAELERAYREFGDHNRFEALGTGVLIDHWSLVSDGRARGLVTAEDFAARPVCEPHVRFLIQRGRAAALDGRTEEALQHLGAARDLAREMPAWCATAWLTEGWARRGAGPDAFRPPLAAGLAQLASIRTASYPMADPVLTTWVVAEAVAAGIEGEVAAALVRGAIAAELADAFAVALCSEGRSADDIRRLVEAATRWTVRGLDDAIAAEPRVPVAVRDAYARTLAEAPLPGLQVRMLGPLEVHAAGRDVRFTRKASRAVLEMLLIEWPRPVHEERLLAAIWPDAAPKQATRSLQTAVNELRRSLDPFHRGGSSYVTFDDDHYVLDLPPASEVDLHRFRDAVPALVREAGARPVDERWHAAMDEALAWWRGELLADAPYAEHAMEARERARALFLEGARALARARADESPRRAIEVLERGLEVDPWWSEGVALLLSCLVREGRVLAAVRWYRDYEARLERELGVPPDEALRAVVEPILTAGAASRSRP